LGRKIFITGRPGVGKTTLIRKVAERLRAEAEGFITEELREGGKRTGFKVQDLSGNEGVLSHVNIKSKQRVGKYCVNVKGFELVAIPAMERAMAKGKILVVDEIGRMELFSQQFRQKIIEAIESQGAIIATIHQKPHPFTDQILKTPGIEIITITEKNRDQLPDMIIQKLEGS
jgi:nucleoside-triphosphatase